MLDRGMRLMGGLVLGLAVQVAGAAEGAHWGYQGEGAPEHWGELAPEFAACSLGKNQSPVDISGAVKAQVPKLAFNYRSMATDVVNNGHTVQTNFAPGSTLKLGEREYQLLQVHFHVPSENAIKGKLFAMEGHLVHKDKDGRLAVVAVMFKPGSQQSGVNKIWQQMPGEAGAPRPFEGKLQASELLPGNHAYYYFSGSLTTPPCSEGVAWIVLKTPMQVSKEQLEAFSHLMHHPNNRPLQPLNARVVIE